MPRSGEAGAGRSKPAESSAQPPPPAAATHAAGRKEGPPATNRFLLPAAPALFVPREPAARGGGLAARRAALSSGAGRPGPAGREAHAAGTHAPLPAPLPLPRPEGHPPSGLNPFPAAGRAGPRTAPGNRARTPLRGAAVRPPARPPPFPSFFSSPPPTWPPRCPPPLSAPGPLAASPHPGAPWRAAAPPARPPVPYSGARCSGSAAAAILNFQTPSLPLGRRGAAAHAHPGRREGLGMAGWRPPEANPARGAGCEQPAPPSAPGRAGGGGERRGGSGRERYGCAAAAASLAVVKTTWRGERGLERTLIILLLVCPPAPPEDE